MIIRIGSVVAVALKVYGADALDDLMFRIPLIERTTADPIDKNGNPVVTSRYYSTISVGSPPQMMRISFDTGSGNVLIPSQGCTSPSCLRRNRYMYDESTTRKDVPFPDQPDLPLEDAGERELATITFGTGEATGMFYNDNSGFREIICFLLYMSITRIL